MGHCEVDLPVMKKFLCCLPMRPGLFAYGLLQLLATLLINIYGIFYYNNLMNWYPNYTNPATLTTIFVSLLLFSIVDMVNCVILMRGVHTKNNNLLEVFFHFQKFKVKFYAILIIICFFISLCFNSRWFFTYNFDPVRGYMLYQNIAVAILDCLLQFYVFLLVRSELMAQAHVVDLPSLCGRMRQPSNLTVADEPKKEPLPDGYMQFP